MILRRRIIAFFTFIGGFYFFLEFVLPKEIGSFEFGLYHSAITTGVRVVAIMAIGLGVINIFKVHGKNLAYRGKHYINSFALLLGFVVTIAIQIADFRGNLAISQSRGAYDNLALFAEHIAKDTDTSVAKQRLTALIKALENREASSELSEKATTAATTAATLHSQLETISAEERNRLFEALGSALRGCAEVAQITAQEKYEKGRVAQLNSLITDGLFIPLGSAMFSLLAFYIAYAAYRSFRIRSKEAAIMLVTAMLVMLGQIPFGPLYISESLPEIRLWLLKNISTPAFRAIYFGAAIAGLSMAVRMWLSMERSPLESDDGE